MDAVVLMAHGTPDSLDEIGEYLRHVMTRRPPTPAFIEEIRERYRAIGGRSPLADITRRQAAALQAKLGIPVFVGMRHWSPWIRDAVAQAASSGARRILGLCLAPQFAAVSIGAYQRALREALPPRVEAVTVDSWHLEPALVEAWRDRVRPVAGQAVLYTAHSIPVEGAGPYPTQVRETVDAIAVPGALAWQSRSPSPVPWLEPDVDTVLAGLAKDGVRDVLVAPVGFVCDHIEVLYDVDILHRATAERLGMRCARTPMPNDDPNLIEALASAARKALA